MSPTGLSLKIMLGALSILLAAVTGPAQAGLGDPPSPASTPGSGVSLPEGPWPPGEILAADPAGVPVPMATATASTMPCPPAPYGVNRYAPGTGRTVALTFDDGPGVSTAAILSILQQNGVPATFFNLGVNSAVRPALVRSEAVAGQALGNHTWDHPRMPTLSTSAQATEMDRATDEQNLLVGVAPCTFRPPYGEYNTSTLSLAQQRRMAVWNWSVDTEDWKAGTSTSSYWVERIVSRALAGGSQQHPVVLMHNPPAGIPATVSALPRIISYYRTHGYQFVDLLGGSGGRAPTPGAATTTDGLHLFVRASDGRVTERTLRGSTWSGWTSRGGVIVGGPATVAIGATTTAVVAAGTDNAVYRMTVTDAGATSGWTSLGGLATSRPSVAVAPNGVESVVVRGTDARAYLRERTGSQWGPWQALGGILAPLAPAAAVTASGELTVAVVGTDYAVWVNTRSAAGVWSGWRRVGGRVTGDIGLSPTSDRTRLVAVVRGTDQYGYVSVGNAAGTSWTGWTRIGGVLASGPAVTVNRSALETFVVGTDNRIYRNTAANGALGTGWTGWQALPAA
ncbi:MAG TPA: polysaccharide deacetylase family protein [Micromonosporaceae bacterium]|nr:polysaccharide deacetylase family protein [Micromonosporaceae bacterium]